MIFRRWLFASWVRAAFRSLDAEVCIPTPLFISCVILTELIMSPSQRSVVTNKLMYVRCLKQCLVHFKKYVSACSVTTTIIVT